MPSLKETYEAIKADNSKGEKNFNVKCTMMPDGSTEVEMGAKPHKLIIDAPAGLDGKDLGPSPLLVILASVGGCIIAVTKFWAKILDIEIREMTVFSRGHINLASVFGLNEDMLPGYDKLEPIVKIKTNAPKEKVEDMMEKVFNHCPIITNMNGASPISPKIKILEE